MGCGPWFRESAVGEKVWVGASALELPVDAGEVERCEREAARVWSWWAGILDGRPLALNGYGPVD